MLFSVPERLLLLPILPEVGDVITLKVVRDLQDILAFTEEEIKLFNLRTQGGALRWDNGTDKEVPLTPKQAEVIVEALKQRDKAKKLPIQLLSLYERVVETKKKK